MPKATRSLAKSKQQAQRVVAALERLYPDATCALVHKNPYELLVATILSAQCTDARVNLVTPAVFQRYPDARALAGAESAELEDLIRSTGFFRAKARNLLGMAKGVVERHGGEIPADLDALTALPGVGRKTANVVLGTAFGIASGVVVDTHVKRLSLRLGLTRAKTPEQIERDLIRIIPRDGWIDLSHRLIQLGRRYCLALRPKCGECPLESICPKIGVKGQAGVLHKKPGRPP
jgi:endonuclease-3